MIGVIETVEINGTEYIKKDSVQQMDTVDGLEAVIVRTYSAGVFYGFLEKREGKEVTLLNARRMWQWFGASLSECAQSGTPNAGKCKFPEAVAKIVLLEAIEILSLTPKALKSLNDVPVWKA